MTNIEIAQLITNEIGPEPMPFESIRSLCYDIYEELGGLREESSFADIYEILREIKSMLKIGLDALRFIAVENSTFGLTKLSTNQTVYYSKNYGETWTELTTSGNVTLNAGEVAYIKGKLMRSNYGGDWTQFKMTGKISAKGNIMYLYDYEHPENTEIRYRAAFFNLFSYCNALVTAPELPATSLSEDCYCQMFYHCTSLTTAPEELPATSLGNRCYSSMFAKCTSLTTAPKLHATDISNFYECYHAMFADCTSLTTAPELPTTIGDRYYWEMFSGCSNLSYIKCLATDISAPDCIENWVENVSTNGTFVKDINTTWPTGDSGIPEGWTVINA